MVAKQRERYIQCAHDAYRACEEKLTPVLSVKFTIHEYSGRALEALKEQWEPNGRDQETAWDWHGLVKHYRCREPDLLTMAVWAGDRLSCLALATTSEQAVHIRFVEGDPREDCPLAGTRALIALETCAGYAQARGKRELKVYPLNSDLERLYVDTYGFEVCRPRKAEPYLIKRV
jgi:hypothetical protein